MSTITLPNIRVGSDLQVRARLKDGGVAIDWSTLSNIKACIYSDAQRALAGRCAFSIDEEDSTLLVCTYAANKPQYLGVNRIVISAKYMGETKTYDKPAFSFVRWTADQEGEEITIDDPDVDVEIDVEDVSSSILQEAVDAAFSAADRANEAAAAAEHMVDIHTGPQGKSAYEVAVDEGYVGTEEQWLASLKGDTGETPDITIGTVTTVAPGTPAAATMTGTPEDPVLNLTIPQGAVGATPAFTVGTVTTGAPGSSVIVTISGTAEAPVLNVTIPQGMQGNTGSSVDYPYELVNNLTTNDATKGLSAAQGVVLAGQVSQLEHKVDDFEEMIEAGYTDTPNAVLTNTQNESCPSYGYAFALTENTTIDGIAMKLKAKSGNTITGVKIELRKDTRAGEVLASKTLSVNINSTTEQEVVAIFDSPVTYSGIIFLCASTDTQNPNFRFLIDYSGNPYLPADGSASKPYQGTIYSYGGTPAAGNTTKVPYAVIKRKNVQFTDKAKEQIDEQIENSELAGEVASLSENFVDGFKDDPNADLTNVQLMTIPGYGHCFALTENKTIGGLTVRIQANSGTSISKVKFVLKKDNRSGEVLAEKYVTVSISDSAYKDVTCIFDAPVTYSGIIFFCLSVDASTPKFAALVDTSDNPYLPPSGTAQKPSQGYIIGSIDGAPTATNATFVIYTVIKYPQKQLSDDMVETLGEQIGRGDVHISLPDKLYAVVGDTLQLFYRGIILAKNPYNYDVLVKSPLGGCFPRYYQCTPTAEHIGTHSLTFQVKDSKGTVIAEKTVSLVVVGNPVSPASAKHIVCVGDSLTQGGQWPAEALRRLTGSGGTPAGKGLTNISFDGPMTKDGAGFFGAGGWSWRGFVTALNPAFRFQVSGVTGVSVGAVYTNNGHSYTVQEANITEGTGSILCSTSSSSNTPSASGTLTKASGTGDATISFSSASADTANPFWDSDNNRVSFVNYANTYCDGTIDAVYTLLSWNGITNWQKNFSTIIGYIKTFADALHTEFPNAKLKIMGIQVPSVNGGFGSNYGTSALGDGYHDQFGMLATALYQNDAYQDLANDEDYASFVEFVNVSSQFDSENNMPEAERPVNTRSEKTELIGTNGVHPANPGYMQIADVVFRNFVANFCQS